MFYDPAKENDLEEFLALEAINQKEEELKTLMIYSGRPGLWNDWIKFQVEARKERQQRQAEATARREKILTWVACGLGFLLFCGAVFGMFKWVMFLKGL